MSARLRIALPFALALGVASIAVAAPAGAQTSALAPQAAPSLAPAPTTPAAPAITPPSATQAPAGPTLEAAAVAVRHVPTTEAAPARRGGYGQPVALMVVGGAAVIVGLIIGDAPGNAIAIGGAVAGLIGLYQYLQ